MEEIITFESIETVFFFSFLFICSLRIEIYQTLIGGSRWWKSIMNVEIPDIYAYKTVPYFATFWKLNEHNCFLILFVGDKSVFNVHITACGFNQQSEPHSLKTTQELCLSVSCSIGNYKACKLKVSPLLQQSWFYMSNTKSYCCGKSVIKTHKWVICIPMKDAT